MYADNTLTPKEAIRLCALGILSENPRSYGDLANEIRFFVSRVTGPSLDLMGDSIELLRYEGLVETEETAPDEAGDARVRITEDGLAALRTLLAADIRPGASSLNELVLALKFRFMHWLSAEQIDRQIDEIRDACETELARLEDLAGSLDSDNADLRDWLGHDLEKLRKRLTWLEERRRARPGPA